MMAALDGEISVEERGELDRLLEQDANLRAEWEKMNRVKDLTSGWTLREPPEEVWGVYWRSVYNRLERGVAWVLVSIGAVILGTWGIWQWIRTLFEDQGIPVLIKVALLAVSAGFLILVFSTIREKFFTWRRDPYKEIER
jgi:hypothetical protein